MKGLVNEDVVLNYIKDFMAKNSYAPSYRDIARGVGLKSVSSVDYWVTVLVKQGKIDCQQGRKRTIVIKE